MGALMAMQKADGMAAPQAMHARERGNETELVGISTVADRLGITLRTIRFYEEVGIITPKRTHAAARLFSEQDIETLRLAVDLRRAMFNLDQVKQILGLLSEQPTTPGRVASLKDLLAEHSAELDRQQIELERARSYVEELRARVVANEG
ncbi:MAG: MerR family transcriptional regulator [Hyphomicrobiaceae bacterium]|nr:MerR family transcriptional regulator [Hyphomicrobiaceae bacterium]